jgi:hypothetical protein
VKVDIFIALLTYPRDSGVAFQQYPLVLEPFLRRWDRRLGNRSETGTEILFSFQTMVHLHVKVLEEPLGRRLLSLGLVSWRRTAFLLTPFHFVPLF